MDNLQTNQDRVEQVPFGTVQHNLSDILPTASEIAPLWSSYLAECMSVSFLKHYVAKSKDPDIHAVLQRALEVSNLRIQAMENIFNSINHPIPEAYGEKDVDVNTKQLFSESFTLAYTRLMHKFTMMYYSYELSLSSRSDFRSYFNECIDTSQEIHQKATEILQAKGLLLKAPIIQIPDRVDFVHNKYYFGALLFGENRPLNAIEISHIHSIMETKQLLRVLNIGYGQTVKSDKIKNFISQEIQLADKQLSKLGSLLTNENLPVPTSIGDYITNSTESSQSDKLILSHVTVVIGYIVSEFGMALTNTTRKDLAVTYSKFLAEVITMAKDGAELMIESGWLEKVPETTDRQKLIKPH